MSEKKHAIRVLCGCLFEVEQDEEYGPTLQWVEACPIHGAASTLYAALEIALGLVECIPEKSWWSESHRAETLELMKQALKEARGGE